MSSSLGYDNQGLPYNATRVVVDGMFQPDLCERFAALCDHTQLVRLIAFWLDLKDKAYSPIYIS